MKKIILASSSDRRKMLLKQIGLVFESTISDFIEEKDTTINPHKLAQKLSLGKAKSVEKKTGNTIVIAADTLVVLQGNIIGKPKDKSDARQILKKLSGKSHLIITGFTVLDTDSGKSLTKSVETKVYFKKLIDKEIDNYVNTGEPLDKAGAYGIQEKGSLFIKKIEGDYFNVVGLPLYELTQALRKFGIEVL